MTGPGQADILPLHLQLALAAARLGAGDRRAQAAMERLILGGSPDWDKVLAMARHHRVFPLMIAGMERAGGALLAQLPQAVLEDLRSLRRRNALHAILVSLEAQRLILSLRGAGVEVSVLKGTALSTMLYGDPSLRHAGDLDLLTHAVASSRRAAAHSPSLTAQLERLAQLGYVVTTPNCRLTPRRLASYQRYWKDLTLEHPERGLVLELHWRLFNNPWHGANRLTAPKVEPVPVYGATVPAMPRVEQFLYAAAHGASDEWVYLKGLVDIATFLRLLSPEELDRAFHLAHRLGLSPQLSSAVNLARLWMGAEVMHPLLLPATDRFHQKTLARIVRRLHETTFRPERRQLGPLDAAALELRLVPGGRTLAEIAGRFLWRPRIWAIYDLPDSLFWLYPVLGLVTLPRPAETDPQSDQQMPCARET